MSRTRRRAKDIYKSSMLDKKAKRETNKKIRQGWKQREDDIDFKKLAGKHWKYFM